jgi:hypothetical protein
VDTRNRLTPGGTNIDCAAPVGISFHLDERSSALTSTFAARAFPSGAFAPAAVEAAALATITAAENVFESGTTTAEEVVSTNVMVAAGVV